MITVTVGDILEERLPDGLNYWVYVIRNGEDVFYVGNSTRITDRLFDHVGQGSFAWAQSPSPVGRLILDNKPESLSWQVDLMSMSDCEPYIKHYWPNFKHYDGKDAERAMIWHYRPYLNVLYNPEYRKMPAHYK